MVRQVHVAVGVIVNARHEVLIALRPDHVHQGGLWEFPGGKVESGESVQQALARELGEELGITVIESKPFAVIEHDYGDKQVKLDTWLVTEIEGSPVGVESQPVRWIPVNRLPQYSFPKANEKIVEKVLAVCGAK